MKRGWSQRDRLAKQTIGLLWMANIRLPPAQVPAAVPVLSQQSSRDPPLRADDFQAEVRAWHQLAIRILRREYRDHRLGMVSPWVSSLIDARPACSLPCATPAGIHLSCMPITASLISISARRSLMGVGDAIFGHALKGADTRQLPPPTRGIYPASSVQRAPARDRRAYRGGGPHM